MLYFIPTLVFSQNIPIGTWRTHFAYQNIHSIAETEEEVYCASENGFFYLNKADNQIFTLSRADGLSEGIVSNLAYHQDSKTLMIVYENANIDFIQDHTIYNLTDVRDEQVLGSKNVNHIYLLQNLAYLSTDFGVVVLDIERREVQDTYRNLGDMGTSIRINASCIAQNQIFVASEVGVLRANLSENLADFNNWKIFEASTGILEQDIKTIVNRGEDVYAGIENEGIFKLNIDSWTNLGISLAEINQFKTLNEQIALCLPSGLQFLEASDNLTNLNNELITNPQDISQLSDKQWIADLQNGLVLNDNNSFINFFPTGTFSANSWKLLAFEGNISAVSGGYNSTYVPLNRQDGFSVFDKNATWTNYNSLDTQNSQIIPETRDLVDIVYNSQTQSSYFASFQQGILHQKADNTFEIIDQNTIGSPLTVSDDGFLKIGGLATDSQGSLWISNHSLQAGQPSLHKLNADGSWQSFSFNILETRFPLDILVARNGFIWVQLSPNLGGGIWVLDPASGNDIHINENSGTGNLPSRNVYAIAQDQEGVIWVGTDDGVVNFFSPSSVFTTSLNAGIPIFENRPLLASNTVYSIAIDGGNRKWIGTNEGLWLFSEDGTRLLEHFTTENSPLISDIVLDVEIQPNTGEVFLATDKGVMSYRSTASEGKLTHQEVKVFPNPVRADFNGLVGISGLVEDANIKITDISGKLIYQTEAAGGTATWNVQDYNGNRAKTGVYLIFSTNFDGTETLVSKIAVIE